MPPFAAEFPIRDGEQADRFLPRDHVADRIVFVLLQLDRGDLLALALLAGRDERGRTQQAPDLVGAKGRKDVEFPAHEGAVNYARSVPGAWLRACRSRAARLK